MPRTKSALTIRTPEAFPRHHLRIARLLGSSLLEKGDWQKAGLAYAKGREAFLLLFDQGLEEAETYDLMTLLGPLFAEAAFAALQRGEINAAFELASEGKARLVAVALNLQTLELSNEKRESLDELRAAVRAEQRAIEVTRGVERVAAVEKLITQRHDWRALIKSAEGRPKSAIGQARALAGRDGAILVPVLTNVGTKILIVTAAHNARWHLPVLDLPQSTTNRLDVLMRGERRDGKKGGWLGAYEINYLPPGERNKRCAGVGGAIADLRPAIWQLGGERLQAALKEHGIKPGTRLVYQRVPSASYR